MARFGTSNGQFVGWTRLPNALVSLSQAIIRKTTGHIPREPWIPFAARRALEPLLSRDSRVWEVGAGYSTLWLADRVGQLTSIEADEHWHRLLTEKLRTEKIGNVDLRFEWRAERMCDFSELPDRSLDLAFIDGGPRGDCLRNVFSKVKPGGHLYLDNWDTRDFWGTETGFPEKHAGELSLCQSFVDYVPAQFGVYEGLLLRKS